MNRIMKLAGILLMGFILAYMGGCASAGGEEKAASKKAGAEQAASPKGRPDVLVAYFSQTGNTRTVAQKLRPNGRHPLRNYAGNSLQQR